MVTVEAAVHRCSAGGVWVPRLLAGSVLVTAVIASRTMDPDQLFSSSRVYRGLVIVLGGIIALWVLKDGGIVRRSVQACKQGLVFRSGRKEDVLEYRDIVHIDYHLPFSSGRHWVPALVLEDRLGTAWRIPSFIEDGAGLVAELLERSDRSELDAWSDARNIPRRMGTGVGSPKFWYAVSGLILVYGLIFPWL
jgi:hypothetical protein